MLAQLDPSKNSTEVYVEPEIGTEPIIGPVRPKALNENVFDAKLNAKATVDMIITVAGEMYGQRDLLEFRGQWEDVA